MFKNIVKISVVTAVVLFSGCGGDNGKSSVVTNPASQELPKVSSDLTSLFKVQRSVDTVSIDDYEEMEDGSYSCSNGGEIKFSTDMNQTSMMQEQGREDFNITQTTEVINCVEDQMITNGKIEIKIVMKKDITTTIMTYITDMNITTPKSTTIVKKGSKTIMGMEDGKEYEIENSEIIIDGKVYKDIELKSYTIELEGDKSAVYEVSGKEQFDGKILTVDEGYDSSKTPMIFDENGNILKGGAQRYIDEQNSTVWLKVIEKNKIEVSVDKDNDGKADELEIIEL